MSPVMLIIHAVLMRVVTRLPQPARGWAETTVSPSRVSELFSVVLRVAVLFIPDQTVKRVWKESKQ